MLAEPVVDLVGVEGTTADYAVTYLRIAALGIPSAFLAIGGQGFLRGVSDLRTPLVIVIAGNVVNVVLELCARLRPRSRDRGLGLGHRRRADGHGHRDGRGDPAAGRPPRTPACASRSHAACSSLGKFIFIRTASLIASFVLAGVVVARLGDAPLAAYQISFQLWIFLALVLDAIAIAGQIIVGQELGASRPDDAYAASVRMIWLSVAIGCRLRGRAARARRRDPADLHVGRRGARRSARCCGRSSR